MELFSPKKILVPVDFSEFSERALRVALEISKTHSSKVFVLSVVDDPIRGLHVMEDRFRGVAYAEGIMRTPAKDWERLRNEVQKEAQRKMDTLISRVNAPNGFQTKLCWGLPVDEIVSAAREKSSDLIVISSHGHTGLSRLFMGSVAEGVLRHAPCPVLIMPCQEEHQRPG